MRGYGNHTALALKLHNRYILRDLVSETPITVTMMVADGLVPIWHQDICIHHADDIDIESPVCTMVLCPVLVEPRGWTHWPQGDVAKFSKI